MFRALTASVIVTLAVAGQAVAQGHGNGHRPAPPSRNSLSAPVVVSSAGGVTPFAWLDDATIVQPGNVSLALSALRWDGSDVSEVDAPIVQVAVGLADRVHFAASVPHVTGSADAAGPLAGIGTSFFGLKIGVIDDRAHGFKLSVSPTLELLGEGVAQALGADVGRAQFGVPVSTEIDRGPVRLFGGAGYFSRGIWFTGGGAGVRATNRVFLSGSFGRSWRRDDDPAVPLSDRSRNELTGAVAYALTPRVSAFGSLGRTIVTLDENGAGTTLAGGVSFFIPARRK
jgi:hypothetical protein